MKRIISLVLVLIIMINFVVPCSAVEAQEADNSDVESVADIACTDDSNSSVDGEAEDLDETVNQNTPTAPLFFECFDNGIGESWGAKVRTGSVSNGCANGEGTVGWSGTEGHSTVGSLLFDLTYTGLNQINAIQWDWTLTNGNESYVLESGESYQITFWAKVVGAEEVIPVNVVKFRDINDNNTNHSNIATMELLATEGWQMYSVTLLGNIDVETTKLLFQAGGCNQNNVKIYLDDFTIQKVQQTAEINVTAEDPDCTSNILVTYGDTCIQGQPLTVVAAVKPEAGALLDCWLDSYGNIVGQGSCYTFTPVEENELTVRLSQYAVPQTNLSVATTSEADLFIETQNVNRSDGTITVSSSLMIPEGFCVVECGVLFYDECYVDNFNLFTDGVVVTKPTNVSTDGVYTVSRARVDEEQAVLVRSYAICKNQDSNILVIYSDKVLSEAESQPQKSSYELMHNHEMLSNFTGYLNAGNTSEQKKDAWKNIFEQFKNTDIDLIVLTPTMWRSNLWQTTADTHWTDYAPTQATSDLAYYEDAKAYIMSGGDPLQDMLDLCDEYGYENVFVNYRMNDYHYTNNKEWPTHNQFYLEHPEYWLNVGSTTTDQTLNYMYPQVRDYYYSLVEELVSNYDVDGLELDFERSPIFFDFDEVSLQQASEIMTDFVGRIRAMMDLVGAEKGKYLQLSVRVSQSLAKSNLVGLDIEKWDELGYVDIVNVTQTYYNTLDLDVESYIDNLSSDAKVYAELQYCISQAGSNRYYTTLEGFKATAANYYARGVDGLSTFNLIYSKNKTRTYEAFENITDQDALKNEEKHYIITPNTGTLPASGSKEFTLHMPEDYTKFASGLVRVETSSVCGDAVVDVYVNNTKLIETTDPGLADETELFPRLDDNTAYPSADYLKYYILPLEILLYGDNQIKIQVTSGDPGRIQSAQLALYHEDSYALSSEDNGVNNENSGNLLVDGDMSKKGNVASGWAKAAFNTNKDGAGSVSWEKTGGVDNSPCLLFDITTSGTAVNAIELMQYLLTMEVQAGKTYRLTFDAKLIGAEDMTFGDIWLRKYDENRHLTPNTSITVSGQTWTTYTLDMTATTTNTGAILVFHLGGDSTENAKLYLDNISLVEVQNLLVDSDMSKSGNVASGWAKAAFNANKDGSGSVSWENAGGVDNSSCLRFDITTSGTAVNAIELMQYLQTMEVQAGKTYRLTFDAKLTGAEDMTFGDIWLRKYDENRHLTPNTSITVSGQTWTTYTLDMTATITNTGAILVFHLGGDSTENAMLYLDNIRLIALS